MTRPVSRRRFLRLVPAAGLAPALGSLAGPQAPAARSAEDTARVHPQFPSQDPALVKEMVSVAHFDPARVRALVEARPALARAAWDWGFGDWETALGAPSHMGNREIAETLLAHGARPTIFSAAMLGQLDVVKAFVAASPGVQRTRGPHGITLLAHARAGKEPAAAVARYLEALGDADPSYPLAPLDEAQRAALVGAYRFGPGADDRLGSLEPGKIANLVVTDGDLFGDETTIRHVFVDGRPVPIEEAAEASRAGRRGGGR